MIYFYLGFTVGVILICSFYVIITIYQDRRMEHINRKRDWFTLRAELEALRTIIDPLTAVSHDIADTLGIDEDTRIIENIIRKAKEEGKI